MQPEAWPAGEGHQHWLRGRVATAVGCVGLWAPTAADGIVHAGSAVSARAREHL